MRSTIYIIVLGCWVITKTRRKAMDGMNVEQDFYGKMFRPLSRNRSGMIFLDIQGCFEKCVQSDRSHF